MKLQTDKKSSRYTTLVCRYLVQQNKIDWITKPIDFNWYCLIKLAIIGADFSKNVCGAQKLSSYKSGPWQLKGWAGLIHTHTEDIYKMNTLLTLLNI